MNEVLHDINMHNQDIPYIYRSLDSTYSPEAYAKNHNSVFSPTRKYILCIILSKLPISIPYHLVLDGKLLKNYYIK